jgi:pyruvate dehydrogenase phosphatase
LSEIQGLLSANAQQQLETTKASVVGEYHINTYAANSPTEDRYATLLNDSGALFGIYDGHGGCGAVSFVKECLMSYIQDSLKKIFKDGFYEEELAEKIRLAMIQAYELADKDFILQGQMDEFKLADAYAGACALTAYNVGRHLFIANSGDCRAVLGRKLNAQGAYQHRYEAVQLSNDHTAETECERLRREHPNEPDVVVRGAIKGNLEPSRAFGDALFKDKVFNRYLRDEYQMPEPYNPPYVTVTPEVLYHYLEPGDSFLIMATDGLWDHLSNEEVVEIVATHKVRTQIRWPSWTPLNLIESALGHTTQNVCTKLIQRVLEKAAPTGTTVEERLSSAIQLDPKEKRKYHDDITIAVIFFDESRFDEAESYKLSADMFKPNPFHIKRNILQRSKSWNYQ